MPTARADHVQRYKQAVEAYRLQRKTKPDCYWNPLLLIATATRSLWEKVQPYLEMDKGNAWLDQLRQDVDLTGGERQLIDLAHSLYNGDCKVNIGDLIDTLDDNLWSVALEAMRLRRGEG